MNDGIQITGLDKALRFMNRFESRYESMVRTLVRRAALLVVKEIKAYVRDSGNFAPNHPATIAQKGSDKPLINHGDLINSITHKLLGDEGFFAGVLKGKKSSDGEDLVNIGWIMEHGVTIKVSSRMRGYLHSIGIHLAASTTTITIPARPFIQPVWESVLPKIKALFVEGFRDQIQAWARG
ncbi:MAG: hypothetical protein KJ621_18245 [Proteobacteria bacterium]|nr:hypothetical protein [Pseudomonadota bacterium]MBU1742059.1 hypothetical protein [Pseudomonadota bacterium]